MRRISVVGTSGSGKTILAQRISEQLDITHIELDSIHHLPGWTPMGENAFRAAVAERLAGESWVVDGNYHSKLGGLVWQRADTVIWLDLPRPVVMAQLVRRTAIRALTRRELWNGNREQWRDVLSLDPQRSILTFAWKAHSNNKTRLIAAQSDPAWADLAFVRLRSRAQIAGFLADLNEPR